MSLALVSITTAFPFPILIALGLIRLEGIAFLVARLAVFPVVPSLVVALMIALMVSVAITIASTFKFGRRAVIVPAAFGFLEHMGLLESLGCLEQLAIRVILPQLYLASAKNHTRRARRFGCERRNE